MHNRIRPYAWGSRTTIAELLGEPSPSAHPQAELWVGAHPADSSTVVGPDGERALVDVVADDPEAALGGRVRKHLGDRLPFLLKVLAAAEPLSLQAHPSADQAARGFAAEEDAGIPRSSPNRNYKDSSHKPELVYALTEFRALCGFRDPAHTVEILQELGSPRLEHYLGLLSGQPDAGGIRAFFSVGITLPSSALDPLLSDVLACCVDRVREGSRFADEYRTTLELGERYPGDPGVLASLLMNHVTLRPGQALSLPAGNLHAYLSGAAIEIMANSDNVLRGGLTPKHVDVPELMRVLDFAPVAVPLQDGEPGDVPDEVVFATPFPEFRLSRLDLGDEPRTLHHDGPQVLLVFEGELRVERVPDGADAAGGGEALTVPRGRSVWVAAADGPIRVSGPATVFRARDGLSD
ncbi:mannose-6-phosphate isomerase, class I [Nakamurella flava]|uniref:mannose-6-phosphate isomerase n=1 Tax=Nakamurella flava TaxID=2576308 RepID=A0A4U6QFQ2_9ACTN|nr:mannose-6-phosphate isomerase, class I [Nakamurella flava]TKV59043.1 mannose-6-phosphate isomerase, class I [Nakamurella flava]